MKKLLPILFLFFSLKSFSQSAGKGSNEKNSSSARKPHAQMQHFPKRKKDKMLKRNGTSYLRRKRQKSKYKVDGDGFKIR